MGLIAQAKADIEQITGNTDDFAVSMTFIAPDLSTATVQGLFTKHHLAIDTEGNPVNVRNAHASVSEKQFIDAGYTVRNSSGEVSMKDHKVTVSDSTGTASTYVIREWYPDETIGLLVFILGDFI